METGFNAVIPTPFSIHEENDRMILDGDGQVVATAINNSMATMIVDLLNSWGTDGFSYYDESLESEAAK